MLRESYAPRVPVTPAPFPAECLIFDISQDVRVVMVGADDEVLPPDIASIDALTVTEREADGTITLSNASVPAP